MLSPVSRARFQPATATAANVAAPLGTMICNASIEPGCADEKHLCFSIEGSGMFVRMLLMVIGGQSGCRCAHEIMNLLPIGTAAPLAGLWKAVPGLCALSSSACCCCC